MNLLEAAMVGNLAEVKRVLKEGRENINQANKFGRTPLHLAATNGHTDIVIALIEKGALVNQADNNGKTPLLLAAGNDYAATVIALVEKGAEVNKVHVYGRTLLHYAVYKGEKDLVLALIEAKVDVNQADNNGETPLNCAAHYLDDDGTGIYNDSDNIEITKILIRAGANVNQTNKDKRTPLHWAAIRNHTDVVWALIEAKADANKSDKYGMTPLNYAAHCHSDTKMIEMLLLKGANVNQANNKAKTPLDYAETPELKASMLKWAAQYQEQQRQRYREVLKVLLMLRICATSKDADLLPASELSNLPSEILERIARFTCDERVLSVEDINNLWGAVELEVTEEVFALTALRKYRQTAVLNETLDILAGKHIWQNRLNQTAIMVAKEAARQENPNQFAIVPYQKLRP